MSKWIIDIHGEIEGDYELICKAESIIPLDKVKKAREEIEDRIDNYPDRNISEYEDCLAILDKLIENEDKE